MLWALYLALVCATNVMDGLKQLGVLLWGAFILVDEALIAYVFEPSHARILIAQLLSLLVVRVPDAQLAPVRRAL